MEHSKKEFTDLFLKGWKQKSCKVIDNETLRVENEIKGDFEPTEIVKLRHATHKDVEIQFTKLNLNKSGISKFDIILSDVFTFTPAEFWGILINFGSMTGEERRGFFKEFELKIYKGETTDENMID